MVAELRLRQTRHFGPIFALLALGKSYNYNFLKNKKNAKRYMMLHQSTNNYDHIMLGCGDVALD